ncbi:MAG: class I SAM-dependent methyltransferase [Sedimentisphaerales bacterium]|jgi:2-polyprenyl-3-methyl-5-hydroxy-6-metoxy-1,4-benzoquinol methylase
MTQNIRTIPVLCNICQRDNATPLWMAIDRLHGFEGQFQYVQCKSCGLVYMNPQIAPECISRFYPDDYAPHQAPVAVLQQQNAGAATVHKPDLPKMILDTLNSQSSVLDIGCGNGEFLNRMRQFCRCRVNGVDTSENAVLCAKKQYGLDVFHGEITAAPFEEKSFDLITAWSCIEHMNNPAQAVKKMFALCKPGGFLFFKTPNYDSFAVKLFKDKWYHLDCPRHLYIFSPAAITALLEKSGFDAVSVCYEPSSKGWLGSLQYVFYGDNYHPATKNKLRRSALAKAFVSPLSRLSAWLKKADTMMITARRKKS